MIGSAAQRPDQSFPKSARLRKRRDFRFQTHRKWHSENFLFVYTVSGKGRLGVSISKKVLRRAVARNRVRRLIRETFRSHPTETRSIDLHLIAKAGLERTWDSLQRVDVEREFRLFLKKEIH